MAYLDDRTGLSQCVTAVNAKWRSWWSARTIILTVLLVMAGVVATGQPASAHIYGGGMPDAFYWIKPYSYHSSWQTPMDKAITEWNKHSKVSIAKNSAALSYAEVTPWNEENVYGRYVQLGPQHFRVRLNSREIVEDYQTSFARWVQSVMAHELGHSLSLADNSYSPSLMNGNRNRASIYRQQTHDTGDVNAYY